MAPRTEQMDPGAQGLSEIPAREARRPEESEKVREADPGPGESEERDTEELPRSFAERGLSSGLLEPKDRNTGGCVFGGSKSFSGVRGGVGIVKSNFLSNLKSKEGLKVEVVDELIDAKRLSRLSNVSRGLGTTTPSNVC